MIPVKASAVGSAKAFAPLRNSELEPTMLPNWTLGIGVKKATRSKIAGAAETRSKVSMEIGGSLNQSPSFALTNSFATPLKARSVFSEAAKRKACLSMFILAGSACFVCFTCMVMIPQIVIPRLPELVIYVVPIVLFALMFLSGIVFLFRFNGPAYQEAERLRLINGSKAMR
jgi:hypothetical protein